MPLQLETAICNQIKGTLNARFPNKTNLGLVQPKIGEPGPARVEKAVSKYNMKMDTSGLPPGWQPGGQAAMPAMPASRPRTRHALIKAKARALHRVHKGMKLVIRPGQSVRRVVRQQLLTARRMLAAKPGCKRLTDEKVEQAASEVLGKQYLIAGNWRSLFDHVKLFTIALYIGITSRTLGEEALRFMCQMWVRGGLGCMGLGLGWAGLGCLGLGAGLWRAWLHGLGAGLWRGGCIG